MIRRRSVVRATQEGQALYPEARRALHALTAAEYSVAASKAAQPLRIAVASLEAVKRSLVSGGFTLISRLASEPEASAGLLVSVPIKGVTIERSLIAIRRHGERYRDPGRVLWRWLEARAPG